MITPSPCRLGRCATAVALALSASAALAQSAPLATPDDAIRAVADRLRIDLEAAAARATVAVPQGTPLRIATRRRGEHVVYSVRLLVGNGESVVEIDGESGEVRSSSELPLDADRRRELAVLAPLLRTATVGAVKAAQVAAARVAGSRALLVEPEIEDDALQFEVTLLGPRGVVKIEVDAATGDIVALVGEASTAPFDPAFQTFDHLAAGTSLDGWSFDAPGVDAPPSWALIADAGARSGPNVLAPSAPVSLPAARAASRLVAWYHDVRLQDGFAEVAIRVSPGSPSAGGAPAAGVGGLVWRLRDGLDHYALTLDGPAKQLRLESLRDGTPRTIASLPVTIAPDRWYLLGVRHDGDRIEILFDGEPKLELRDAALPAAGAVGVWSRGDAMVRFDDLRIQSKRESGDDPALLSPPKPVGPAPAAQPAAR